MRTSAIVVVKTTKLFEIYGVSARKRWVESVRIFCRQGGGVNVSRFYADVFYGRLL